MGRFKRMFWRRASAAVFVLAMVGGLAGPIGPAEAQAPPETRPLTDCPWITDPIKRLYSAYFLRAPEQAGFDFWVGRLDGGQGLAAISDFFAQSEEFEILYATLSDEEFVRRVYQNVLGRPPEQEGLDFWVGQLAQGMSRGTLMLKFSEGEEYVTNTATASPAAGYFSAFPDGTTFVCGEGNVVYPIPAGTQRLFSLILPIPGTTQWTTQFQLLDVNGAVTRPDVERASIVLYTFVVDPASTQAQLVISDGMRWSMIFTPTAFPCGAMTDTWVNQPCGLP